MSAEHCGKREAVWGGKQKEEEEEEERSCQNTQMKDRPDDTEGHIILFLQVAGGELMHSKRHNNKYIYRALWFLLTLRVYVRGSMLWAITYQESIENI